ncbi:high-affinity choline transporter 1-like [Liolophura sinensis]|uniref:high-affinity choline transporter 1-like n=1 Tax=Liolophura sinensis TaxID=3198878 RepID=UPI003158C157
MAVDIAGLISVIVFYVIILAVGIWAGRKTARSKESDDIFLASRNLGGMVSFFTLAATMVGGGYINGSAEMMYSRGFLWTQAPIGYNCALCIAGLVFAPKVRQGNYITIFDPFQNKYGNRLGSLLFVPQLLGDLFWSASILSALGASLSIILGIDGTITIIVSACVAIGYTFFGGLYSVAFTDVIQMICIFAGLFVAFPFALTNEAVDLSKLSDGVWQGSIQTREVGVYVDSYLLLIMGGIPWQVYYQRALACRTSNIARWASVAGGVAAAVQAIPPMALGAAVAAANWNMTAYNTSTPLSPEQTSLVVPLALQYLCPKVVSIIGLGAVSAAVMSSADSCVLSTASVLTHNIYANIIRPRASHREKIWVMRISILVSGALGTIVAISVSSIYGLFFLCSDLMYVINFPQLVCVLWISFSNTYGYLVGFIVGLGLRISAGEPLLGLPALLLFPGYDEELGQLFPFRSFTMVTGLLSTIMVSYVTNQLFLRKILPKRLDFLRCVTSMEVTVDKADIHDAQTKGEAIPLSENQKSDLAEDS